MIVRFRLGLRCGGERKQAVVTDLARHFSAAIGAMAFSHGIDPFRLKRIPQSIVTERAAGTISPSHPANLPGYQARGLDLLLQVARDPLLLG